MCQQKELKHWENLDREHHGHHYERTCLRNIQTQVMCSCSIGEPMVSQMRTIITRRVANHHYNLRIGALPQQSLLFVRLVVTILLCGDCISFLNKAIIHGSVNRNFSNLVTQLFFDKRLYFHEQVVHQRMRNNHRSERSRTFRAGKPWI